jgi:hypothetical protein
VLILGVLAAWLARARRLKQGVANEAKRSRRLQEQLGWDKMRDRLDNPR